MPDQKPYYSDVDYQMKIDRNGNVVVHKNEESVNQNIKSILATVSGERVRNNIGSGLIRLLFQPLSSETTQDLKFALREVLDRFEPRITILGVRVVPDYDRNEYNVQIRYKIKTAPQTSVFTTRLRSLQDL